MRPRVPLAAGAILGLAAISAVAVAASGESTGRAGSAATTATPRTTAKVERRDLVDTTTVSGTVTYGNTSALKVQGSGQTTSTSTVTTGGSSPGATGGNGSGNAGTTGGSSTTTTTTTAHVITALPAVGTVLTRGATAFEVNGAPGPAMLIGTRPMWRTLKSGVADGVDVAQFESNLAALGYTDGGAMVVDDHYNSYTAAAVRAWQTARGVTVNGTVAEGDVVYEPNDVRVASLSASIGDTATGTIMQVTGTTRLIHVALDPTNADYVKIGGNAAVTLADNSTTTAKFLSLSSVASTSTSSSGNGAGGGGNASTTTSTLDLYLVVPKPPANLLENSSVTITLVTDRASQVLAVPVNALFALAEGGYAVEKVDGAGTKLVAVTTGKFADSFVQVTGALAVGDEVVTAAS